MPLSKFEQQLYDLLIDIKQTNASMASDLIALKQKLDGMADGFDKLEQQVDANTHEIVKLKAVYKAWMTASATIGAIIGWSLSTLKEALFR